MVKALYKSLWVIAHAFSDHTIIILRSSACNVYNLFANLRLIVGKVLPWLHCFTNFKATALIKQFYD